MSHGDLAAAVAPFHFDTAIEMFHTLKMLTVAELHPGVEDLRKKLITRRLTELQISGDGVELFRIEPELAVFDLGDRRRRNMQQPCQIALIFLSQQQMPGNNCPTVDMSIHKFFSSFGLPDIQDKMFYKFFKHLTTDKVKSSFIHYLIFEKGHKKALLDRLSAGLEKEKETLLLDEL